MNEKHREVRAWLEGMFDSVPSYPVTEDSVNRLHQLMRWNQDRNKDVEAMTELMAVQTDEYKAEYKRLADITKMNDDLCPYNRFASSIAGAAQSLGVDDPSDMALLLALDKVKGNATKILTDEFRLSQRSEDLKAKNISSFAVQSRLQNALKSVETEARKTKESDSHSKKKMEFMRDKQREYTRTLDKYETILRRNGLTDQLMHEALTKLKAELDAESSVLSPLVAQLEGYHQLPPSLELAKVKVSEARNELERLSVEVTKEINTMHI